MTRDHFWEYMEFVASCVCVYTVIAILAFPFLIGGKLCH